MLLPATVVFCILVYLGMLYVLAMWVERSQLGRRIAGSSWVYALSLAVYCTSWSFYGTVGLAVHSGLLFLAVYVGPVLVLLLLWRVIRKMVRIKHAHRVTSLADFVSLRYGRSQTVAVMVTLAALIGSLPYLALQLKSVITTFNLLVSPGIADPVPFSGPVTVIIMALFTIVFGVRRIDPTERHPGIVTAVAVESVVKLAAMLLLGLFVVGRNWNVPGIDRVYDPLTGMDGPGVEYGGLWLSMVVLSMSAFLFLPRQFHLAVVENSHEEQIQRTRWLFPAYLLLFLLFVIPIARAGVAAGLPLDQADTFVLQLPQLAGRSWLSLLVFLGGFSAAMSMIVIALMTLSTMVTNHLFLPLAQRFAALSGLQRRLLQGRWVAVVVIILIGYGVERLLSESYMLARMGLMSFAGVLQFAPVILGGLVWNRATRKGAYWGIGTGYAVWLITMVVPACFRSSGHDWEALSHGIGGIALLRPEQLFGIGGMDPLMHTVFWSLLLNTGSFVIVSLMTRQDEDELRSVREFFPHIIDPEHLLRSIRGQQDIELMPKADILRSVFAQYFSDDKAAELVQECLRATGLVEKDMLSIVDLSRLQTEAERLLSGATGAAAAKQALSRSGLFSAEECQELSKAYSKILVQLNVDPADMLKRIEYFQDRSSLLQQQAHDLELRIAERDREMVQRCAAEEGRRLAEEQYRSIFENAVEGIYQSTLQGRFLNVNPAMARILLYESPQELIDGMQNLREELYVDPEDRDRLVAVLQLQGRIESFETRVRRQDESIIWISINARSVWDEQGVFQYIEGFVVDISKRKQAEAELQSYHQELEERVEQRTQELATTVEQLHEEIRQRERMEDELVRARKLESIGLLAGGIAHDFNNLLTIIQGNVDLAFKRVTSDDEVGKALDRAREVLKRARELTGKFITFATGGEPLIRPLSIKELLEDTVSLALSGSSVQCRYDIPADLWAVAGDAAQLRQALFNIIENAREASPPGGRIEVGADNLEIEQDVARTNPFLHKDRYVHVTIRDHGPGIPRGHLHRIFDPYFTSKETGKERGLGLGLAITYSIVSRHAGHVFAESDEGKGTTLHVYVPASSGGEEQPGIVPASTRLGPKRVLLMDDENMLLDLACEALEMLGHTVTTATTGEEAIKLFKRAREQDSPFDVVILDLTVPGGMGGKETVLELLQIDPRVKAVVSSGYARDPILARYREYGFRAALPKPYSMEQLGELLERMFDDDQGQVP